MNTLYCYFYFVSIECENNKGNVLLIVMCLNVLYAMQSVAATTWKDIKPLPPVKMIILIIVDFNLFD